MFYPIFKMKARRKGNIHFSDVHLMLLFLTQTCRNSSFLGARKFDFYNSSPI